MANVPVVLRIYDGKYDGDAWVDKKEALEIVDSHNPERKIRMIKEKEMPDHNIDITKADVKDKEKLKKLFQFYLHDLSEYTEALDVNAKGEFDNNDVDAFFDETNLIPMAIKLKEEIIGFIFLNNSSGNTVDYIINDIFILRKYRNRGIGKEVVNKLFKVYPGKYGLLELAKNKPAVKFWHSVFKDKNLEYQENEIKSDGEDCLMQKFTIKDQC